MKKEKNDNSKIDSAVLKNYVEIMNSIKAPMNKIKAEIYQTSNQAQDPKIICNESLDTFQVQIISIKAMIRAVKAISDSHPNEQTKIYTDIIKQIMNINNGMITTRMIEPLNISRQYLFIMEKNNEVEKISRGIYISPSTFEDCYYSFQQRYKKAIFSHMNALYFYGMTEEFPYTFTITVPQNYHVNTINKKCNVFYTSEDIYEMGITEMETPNGNKVRVYDRERCICDIIRSKGRMDLEQVKKTIRRYKQCKDKNLTKLSMYANKMGISEKIMEMVGDLYYE